MGKLSTDPIFSWREQVVSLLSASVSEVRGCSNICSHVCLQPKWDHKAVFLKKHTATIKFMENWTTVLKNVFKDQKEKHLFVINLIYSGLDPGASLDCFLPTHCAFMKYTHTYSCPIIWTRFIEWQKLLLTASNKCKLFRLAATKKKWTMQITSDLVVFS